MKVSPITFNYDIPSNYHPIDNWVSRSAQPNIKGFEWLKQKGVTDVINFRTYVRLTPEFDEKAVVESLGMKYHHLPSITAKPTISNVEKFLQMIGEVKSHGGKAHIHCMAGADRTGTYSFIYKMMNKIGSLDLNLAEWKAFGLNFGTYPHLTEWAKCCVERLSKRI